MRNILITLFVLLVGSVSVAYAQETETFQDYLMLSESEPSQELEREISYEELPEHVQFAFEESPYSMWKVDKVVQLETTVETESGTTYYLTVSNEADRLVISYDQGGYPIE